MSTTQDDTWLQKHGAKLLFSVLFILAMVAILIAAFHYRKHIGTNPSNDQEILGQFGDYFGGLLNPILSFLALIALLYTIIIQSKELKLTRNELSKSSDALDAQSESLKLQNFENIFFQLLNRHTKTITMLKFGKLSGYPALVKAVNSLSQQVSLNFGNGEIENDSFENSLDRSSKEMFANHDFYRLLNESIDLIDCLINQEDLPSKQYINSLKRQYSKYELILLYLYILTDKDLFLEYKDFLIDNNYFETLDLELIEDLPEYIKSVFPNLEGNKAFVEFLAHYHNS